MGKHKKEKRSKKHKKEKKKHKKRERKRHSSTSDSSNSASSADEWIEKETSTSKVAKEEPKSQLKKPQDDWDFFSAVIPTTSRVDKKAERDEARRKEKEANQYDPSKCSRELNPYWKDGGDGLPKFMKPSESSESSTAYRKTSYSSSRSSWRKRRSSSRERKQDSYAEGSSSSSAWKKQEEKPSLKASPPRTLQAQEEPIECEEILTDKQMNELAAKVLKAEIMGNNDLAAKLKQKLENARNAKKNPKNTKSDSEEDDNQHVILTRTDSKGFSKPLSGSYNTEADKYGGRKAKKKKVETHEAGARVRYFPDDDKYSLQQMFENEKFNSVEKQEAEFVKLAGKMDDFDDRYEDKIRHKDSDEKSKKRARDEAIGEHQRSARTLDNCTMCLQSDRMEKHLMIALGQTAYLTLPAHEPLTEGHCLITPNRHVPCGTQLDENEWDEIMDFRRSLTRMFSAKDEDVIFFEVATGLHRFPHMSLECVPVPREEGDMAPIYFKKAIDECEMEWAQNKKLVSLKGRDVRRAVPKGLSYFCVSFGMEEGFAHVIEDQQLFPNNFAQEIIGGMLDLHHSKWRKPKREQFEAQKQRVLKFSKEWSKYDCTSNK